MTHTLHALPQSSQIASILSQKTIIRTNERRNKKILLENIAGVFYGRIEHISTSTCVPFFRYVCRKMRLQKHKRYHAVYQYHTLNERLLHPIHELRLLHSFTVDSFLSENIAKMNYGPSFGSATFIQQRIHKLSTNYTELTEIRAKQTKIQRNLVKVPNCTLRASHSLEKKISNFHLF